MSSGAVEVAFEVREGILAVRDSGALNMFDYVGVMCMASSLGFHETSKWMAEHKSEYSRGIFNGFIVKESVFEN